MNDFFLQPGSRFEGAPRSAALPYQNVAWVYISRNRGFQWGGSIDDWRLIFTSFDGLRSNFEIIKKSINNDLEVTHPQNGSLSGLIPSRIGMCNSWNFWLLRRGEKRSTRRKTPQSEEENQQQTQPTHDVHAGIWTRVTLVGGEHYHHCAIPCFPKPKTSDGWRLLEIVFEFKS